MANPNDQKQNRRQNKSEDWQRKHYRVQRLIAIGGVLGLVVLSLQWCEMRKSTDAATEAAKAAKDGIELARENIRQDLRAWVLVSAASLNAPIQENHPLVTTLICNNFGKTPAFDVSVSYWTAISAEIDPSKLPRDTASGIESVAIQPPGVPLTGTANFVAVTEEHARMLKAGAIYSSMGKSPIKTLLVVNIRLIFACSNIPQEQLLLPPIARGTKPTRNTAKKNDSVT